MKYQTLFDYFDNNLSEMGISRPQQPVQHQIAQAEEPAATASAVEQTQVEDDGEVLDEKVDDDDEF